MTTIDVVACAVAAVVTVLVCLAFVARTRHVRASARTPLALGAATGLSALVAVLAVHLVPAAGQGDMVAALGELASTGVDAITRTVTILAVVLAAAVGAVVGIVMTRHTPGTAA